MRSFKEQWGLKVFSISSHRSHLEKKSISFLGCCVLKIKLRREIEENRRESIGEIRVIWDNFIFFNILFLNVLTSLSVHMTRCQLSCKYLCSFVNYELIIYWFSRVFTNENGREQLLNLKGQILEIFLEIMAVSLKWSNLLTELCTRHPRVALASLFFQQRNCT